MIRVLLGGVLLLAAALRARARRRLVGWGLAGAVLLLAGGLLLAQVSGLASGQIEPEGWPWVLVVLLLAAYVLAVLDLAVAGILLVRDLFRPAA